MRKLVIASFLALSCAANAFARDPISDGKLQLRPAKNDRFEAAEFILGKAELYGYVADLKDSGKITGIVLQHGERATPAQKHIVAVIAHAQHLSAFIDLDGKEQPLTDPTPNGSDAPAATSQGDTAG
jgi:hypothetical protein